ncbi:MAG: nitrogenase component 1, partial [Methanomassiliicoccaceae archaeon]|nr:nitrogenase component 1 [Methanomassiliicoccaceae archaeon]
MSFEYDRPEGMLGSILAIEGIRDSMTLINGPTGCKYYPSSSSEAAFTDRGLGDQKYNAFRYYREFFFSQPRVPCTYMDGKDYIMGAGDKPERAYEAVMKAEPNIVGLINSPGASLIGERLSLKNEKGLVVRLESPSPSVPVGTGFQNAFVKVLDTVSPKRCEKREGVNLIGMSIWHLGWEDSISDLTHLLEMCGIKVNTAIGAGCSVADIRDSGKAAMNVMVHRDFGSEVAKWYEKNLGVPSVGSDMGAPIGFDALEDWI